MLGAFGCGALISNNKPASSTAFKVLVPKAPIFVPFCLNFGKFSNKLFTPPGVKKQITSNFFAITSLISLLIILYNTGVANSQLCVFNQEVISLSKDSDTGYKNFSLSLCLLITSNKLLLLPSAP